MHRHGDLAVTYFAQGPRILARHPNRVTALFGETRVVYEPSRGRLKLGCHPLRQPAADRLPGPGTLPHELLQGLHVGAGHASGQRFDRFSFPIQQQALHIKRAVMTALGAPHTSQHGGQKLLQPLRAGCQLSGIHACKVYAARFGELIYT